MTKCCHSGCQAEATVGMQVDYYWGLVSPIAVCESCLQRSGHRRVPLPTLEEMAAPTVMYDEATQRRELDRLMPQWAAQQGVELHRAPSAAAWWLYANAVCLVIAAGCLLVAVLKMVAE